MSTSDELLEQRSVPGRLVIIGAGVVAFEFAHVFARLGTSVYLLNRSSEPLKSEDRDLVARVVEHMKSLGVVFHSDIEVKRIERKPTALDVHLSDDSTVAADFVLNAAGRPPNIEGLGLERAHVKYGSHGVEVNDYLRSAQNPRIFAAGDAHGKRELSPVASYEGALIAHNFLNGDERRAEYSAIPRAVFVVPPLASVGMTESEARKQGQPVDVVTHDMSEWTVFRIAGKKPSHGKVIAERDSGRILGAHLFGPGADDNIHIFAMAMRYGITRERLAELIYAYPTFGSAMGSLLQP